MRVLTMLLAVLLLSFSVDAQIPANPDPSKPDFTLTVEATFDAETLAAFMKRIQDYAELRKRLEQGLPPLRMTTNPDEIETFEHRLADRIREVRGSERGQLFVPRMEAQVKRMLELRVNAATIAAIMDDGPSEFDIDINDTYSKRRPLATMPPNILLRLPDLPRDLEFRFVGRHLVLRDARANVILDEIPHALRCDGDCTVKKTDDEEH
jgi:hypothetical protein